MTLILPRRQFLAGLVCLVAAPAIVRVSSLMPVKAFCPLSQEEILREIIAAWEANNSYLIDFVLGAGAVKVFAEGDEVRAQPVFSEELFLA